MPRAAAFDDRLYRFAGYFAKYALMKFKKRVEHQQRFVRRVGNQLGDHAVNLFELLHKHSNSQKFLLTFWCTDRLEYLHLQWQKGLTVLIKIS